MVTYTSIHHSIWQRFRHIALTVLLIVLTCRPLATAQRTSTAIFPMVTNVERQPLQSHIQRLQEAFTFLGEPLPVQARHLLSNAAGEQDSKRYAEQIQRALDPLCIATIHIPVGKPFRVIPAVKQPELLEQGWRVALIKVVNESQTVSPLWLKSPNARPIAESPAADVSNRWLDLSMFINPPMMPNLSGLELEYRIVQIYSRSTGTKNATLDFNLRQNDLPTSAPTTNNVVGQKAWQFDKGTDGWMALSDCSISTLEGRLIVNSKGIDPYLAAPLRMPGGKMLLQLRIRSLREDIGQVFWATQERPNFDGERNAAFPIHDLKGGWQELSIPFTVGGTLTQLRIDTGNSGAGGKVEFASIRLINEGNPGQDWRSVVYNFTTVASTPITFQVKDESGKPATAAFLIRDRNGRIYPPQTKRMAPDFHFQPQIYRRDGEKVRLPAGTYTVECSRGPEVMVESRNLVVGTKPLNFRYQTKRWIDPAKFGWWSGDHHIHAAGCAHYNNPTEGVFASDMQRHIEGEDLKVGCNLTWGPCFDFQKQFFTGSLDKVSSYPYLLRYDIEVSGFGSHQSGHLCLLRLKEQIPPGGDSKNHWTTVCLNTLKWAKKQGAVVGTAHSANGLMGSVGRVADKDGPDGLPTYAVPPFNGIGAMEYIADVTHLLPGATGELEPAIDFLATMDTDLIAELNIWYHTLNCGFRTRVSGETDFPCITGERVGKGRSYVKLKGKLDFDTWCEGIKKGACYVSDGQSHLIDFKANGLMLGDEGSEIRLEKPGTVRLTAKASALWRNRGGYRTPTDVEVVFNGYPIARKRIQPDGSLQDVSFDIPIAKSGWVALRLLGSSHTNPFFVLVEGKPIRASKRSAEWCLRSVDQCWKEKARHIAPAEFEQAKAVYDHARRTYQKLRDEMMED